MGRVLLAAVLALLACSCVAPPARLRLLGEPPCALAVEVEAADYEASLSCVLVERLPWDLRKAL
jgi:hypothetical protein